MNDLIKIEDLNHVTRDLEHGGMVLVLNTGPVISAESEAMLQALHSRSIGGIRSHLQKLAKTGSENFMATFYVGYGHKSIGDCASVTLFIEGVSMLAAKAIQDSMLYNGQEASTRYIDFANQRFADPWNSPGSRVVLDTWREFYLEGLVIMQKELQKRHPRNEGEEANTYEKAIKARAFDIMRGFLPAGATTNLAWHGELRHVSDQLDRLRHHPLWEVREVAEKLEDALSEVYPSSFQKKRYQATEGYVNSYMGQNYYFNKPPRLFPRMQGAAFYMDTNGIDGAMVVEHEHLLRHRPPQTELPKFVGECGTMRCEYLLDFASWRDNQRHRAVIQRMPLLTPDYGFGEWYLEQLPEDLRKRAERIIAVQLKRIASLEMGFVMSAQTRQYYLPMGLKVSCRMTGDLPAFVYLVERRARLDVHPTMRTIAQKIGAVLLETFGSAGLRLYMETSGDRFYYERGKQDIVEKQTAKA